VLRFYTTARIRDSNGGNVLKPFLCDGLVEVLSFVVSIDGCFGDLVNIETRPEGVRVGNYNLVIDGLQIWGIKDCFQNF
jgi:hypothetical protein